MLGYIIALVMNLATHNGNETWAKMRKHIECNKSRENPILKLLVVPKASPGASPLLMLLQELSHV